MSSFHSNKATSLVLINQRDENRNFLPFRRVSRHKFVDSLKYEICIISETVDAMTLRI